MKGLNCGISSEKKKWFKFLKKYPWMQQYSSETITTNFIVLSAGYIVGVDQNLIKNTYPTLDENDIITSEIFIPKNESFTLIKVANHQIAQNLYENHRFHHVKLPWINTEVVFTLKYLKNYDKVKKRFLTFDHIAERTLIPPSLDIRFSYTSPMLEHKLTLYCTELYNSLKTPACLNNQDWCVSKLATRYAVHYGYKFEYTINNVIKLPHHQSIPPIFDELIDQLLCDNIINERPNQLTINFYEPGDGIRSHVDVHSCFGERILCLSLASGIMMTFKDLHGNKLEKWLERNSLLVMRDEIRYEWKHGIVSRYFDMVKTGEDAGIWTNTPRTFRVSVTLRHIPKDQSCNCECFELCDVKNPSLAERDHFKRKPQDYSEDLVKDLEKIHVKNFYDEVAEHFSQTRRSPWKKVSEFLSTIDGHSVVYDIGCGNGKYMQKCQEKNLTFIGSDSSFNLLEICRRQNFEVFQADALHLPLRDCCCDYTLCIAVMHHIATVERRKQLISELIRITRSKGKILLSVWCDNIDDNRAIKKAIPIESTAVSNNKTTIAEENNNVEESNEKSGKNDYLVPWTLRNNQNDNTKLMMRYIHLFSEEDIRSLVDCFNNVTIVESLELDHCNWFVTLCKL